MFAVVFKQSLHPERKAYYNFKEAYAISLLYLGFTSLQTRTKLQKSVRCVLSCCKLQVVFKVEINSNNFSSKDVVP